MSRQVLFSFHQKHEYEFLELETIQFSKFYPDWMVDFAIFSKKPGMQLLSQDWQSKRLLSQSDSLQR
jgi:hypothetical protein